MTDSSAQKILCVLYDDPLTGFPPDYARANIPSIDQYPDGQSMPTPDSLGFTPGELLGSVSGGLGLRKFLEERGHSFVVTSDKDGPDSVFEAELPDADVVISQPFWPGYLTAERIAKAPNLKMAITAGIGSDHVDLQAAINSNVTVCEVTWCNSISVAEHAVMQMLALVRDYIPQYGWVVRGGWNIADAISRSYDIEGMDVGVVAAGRIGLGRMKPFDVKLHYTDNTEVRSRSTKRRVPGQLCDVVSIHCPLHPETEHMFDDELISKMLTSRRQDLRPRRYCQGAGERPVGRVCGGRLVPTCAERPSLERHAQPRHDPSYFGNIPVVTRPVGRSWNAGSTGIHTEYPRPGRRADTAKDGAHV